jgi:S-adenosylmethionine hydrolase
VVPVEIGGKRYELPFVKTFSDVPVGKGLLYIDSRGRLSVGINQRNFAEINAVAAEAEVVIPRKR